MHVFRQAVEVQAFINQTEDAGLGDLLRQRLMAIEADGYSMEELARFIVLESGDSLAHLETQLGCPLFAPGGFPLWEFVEDHGSAFEMVFVLSSSGYGALVFASKQLGPPALLRLCAAHASPER